MPGSWVLNARTRNATALHEPGVSLRPVPAHLRPPVAYRRCPRRQSDAPRRLEEPPDARLLWRLGRRRARAGGLQAVQPWRSAV